MESLTEEKKEEDLQNIVNFEIKDTKIMITIPDKNIINEFDNVFSFDSRDEKLISAGITKEKFKEDYARKWEKYSNYLEFRPIFDVTFFQPEIAGMFLWNWWNDIVQQGLGRNSFFRFQLKLELNITFNDYKKIPPSLREEFEYLTLYMLYTKKLTINNEEIISDKNIKLPRLLFIILNFSSLLIFLFLSIFPLVFLFTKVSFPEAHPFLSFSFYIASFLIPLILFTYAGNSFSIIFWVLCMKPLISNEIISRIVKYEFNSPKIRKLDKLTRIIVNRLIS